jgi:transcriptional regulator with XRE-family HTH domain
METLGDKIKYLRKELTQEELASVLQVDRSTLASWEVNRREPDIATLCRMAAFFEVSVDWLVGHEPPAEYKTKINPGAAYESSVQYPDPLDKAWEKVIGLAHHYGVEPEAVYQLIELNAKIALTLKKE